MTHPIPHLCLHSLFVLLSVADLALTWWLLACSGGRVYEANPVAQLYLDRHGWAGLACFKAGVVLLVLGLAATIARSRPRLSGGIVCLGCAVLSVVVLYSASLSRAALLSPQEWAAELAREDDERLQETNRHLREVHRQSAAFWTLLEALCQDLLAGRRTLQEAAEQTARSEKAQDPTWLRAQSVIYPGRSQQELMAICVMNHAVSSQQSDQRAARRVALRLERQFQLAYGRPSPRAHQVSDAEESVGAGDEALDRAPERAAVLAPLQAPWR